MSDGDQPAEGAPAPDTTAPSDEIVRIPDTEIVRLPESEVISAPDPAVTVPHTEVPGMPEDLLEDVKNRLTL